MRLYVLQCPAPPRYGITPCWPVVVMAVVLVLVQCCWNFATVLLILVLLVLLYTINISRSTTSTTSTTNYYSLLLTSTHYHSQPITTTHYYSHLLTTIYYDSANHNGRSVKTSADNFFFRHVWHPPHDRATRAEIPPLDETLCSKLDVVFTRISSTTLCIEQSVDIYKFLVALLR